MTHLNTLKYKGAADQNFQSPLTKRLTPSPSCPLLSLQPCQKHLQECAIINLIPTTAMLVLPISSTTTTVVQWVVCPHVHSNVSKQQCRPAVRDVLAYKCVKPVAGVYTGKLI